ncbi:hypothetical protein [Leisingera sp.]|nr:hypothetical protein [Leisingera sp.]
MSALDAIPGGEDNYCLRDPALPQGVPSLLQALVDLPQFES